MGIMVVGSARWIAQEAAAAARGPNCAIDAIAHALVHADDSLLTARSLASDRIEAARWVHAADRDLAGVPEDRVSTNLLASLTGTRAAITGSLRAPDACFDRAIDAARASLAETARAGGRSVDEARAGAAACRHADQTAKLLGEIAPGATATRAALDNGDLAMDTARTKQLVAESARAKYPDNRIDDAHRAVARTVRDELATTFDPLVHDLIEHTRQLRDVPIERMARTPHELQLKPAPRPELAMHIDGPLTEDSHAVARVDELVGEVRTKSGNGTQVDLPVGDYGAPLALAQAKAAQVMHEVILTRLATDLHDVGTTRKDLLDAWTFQRDHVAGSMLEGVTSIAQATAVATQRRLPGMDEFALLDKLADSHVYDRLAKAPIGVIGPIARTGWRFETPLAVDAAGGVRLGPQLDELYKETAAARAVEMSPNKTTRAGCPLALRGRSLTLADGSVVTYDRTILSELAREYLDLVGRFLRAEQPGGAAAAAAT